jgi:hypothetical protein
MSNCYREKFASLCRAIRSDKATMLECRNIESGALMVVVCSTKQLPDGQMEYIPLARMIDHVLGSLVLPTSNGEGTVRSSEVN